MRRNCLLWRRICLPHERMGEGLGSAKNVGEYVESGDGALIGQVLYLARTHAAAKTSEKDNP